jgi:ATP-dependent RNA helicase DDX19/DBP5
MSDLASRITKPNGDAPDATPAAEPAPAAAPATDDAKAEEPTLETAQVDGSAEIEASGLNEPDFDVEISLSDLQNNEATPFHSATAWQDLGLSVTQQFDAVLALVAL